MKQYLTTPLIGSPKTSLLHVAPLVNMRVTNLPLAPYATR